MDKTISLGDLAKRNAESQKRREAEKAAQKK